MHGESAPFAYILHLVSASCPFFLLFQGGPSLSNVPLEQGAIWLELEAREQGHQLVPLLLRNCRKHFASVAPPEAGNFVLPGFH